MPSPQNRTSPKSQGDQFGPAVPLKKKAPGPWTKYQAQQTVQGPDQFGPPVPLDPTRAILDPLNVDRAVKHAAWDAYHNSQTPEQFRAYFDTAPIPQEAKRALWNAKFGGGATQSAAASSESTSTRPEYFGFTPSHMLEQAGTGLKQLGSGLVGSAEMLLDPRVPVLGSSHYDRASGKVLIDPASMAGAVTAGLPEEEAKAHELWREPGVAPKIAAAGHELASYVPFLGPWAASLGEQAGSGDIGGALARGGTQALAVKAAGPVAERVSERIGPTAGKLLRTPEGKLRPSARIGARAAGYALGRTSGLPEAGLVGAMIGPSVLDEIAPRRPFELTRPLYDDARNEMYNERAQDLMQRQLEQDRFDRQAGKPGMTVTVPERVAAIPRLGSPTPFEEFADRQARERASAASPAALVPGERVTLGAPEAGNVLRIPEPTGTENPGWMASVPREQLPDLARRGAPGAGQQLKNLGRPVLYIPSLGAVPREIIRFP